MHFTFPFIITLALIASTNAADCKISNNQEMRPWLQAHESDLWGLRQRMCGDGDCGNKQECTLSQGSKDGGSNIYRKDVQYEFPNCWDATANIITQCQRNRWQQGWWQLGDEFYQINVSPDYAFKRDLANQTEET